MSTAMRNTWTRLAMALVLAVGGLVGFTPAPASAAACYAGSCDYWDPGTAGCVAGSEVRSEFTLRSWRYKPRGPDGPRAALAQRMAAPARPFREAECRQAGVLHSRAHW